MEELYSEDYEKSARKVTQKGLRRLIATELLPNGAYAPVKGIYDIGWREWESLPAADYVRELRRLDDELIKENETWILGLAPLVYKGELNLEQIRLLEFESYINANDTLALRIAAHAFDNSKNREIRDIILRHASEETGHGELKADFLVNAFGMDLEKDIWNGTSALEDYNRERVYLEGTNEALKRLKKASPPLAYAIIPFLERCLPRLDRMKAEGYRKQYGFPAKYLTFFDLHTYVDIYHERLGLYVIGKYATTRELQDLVRDAVLASRENRTKAMMALYNYISRYR
ncbi:MAG: iron-containing redox enzyme family protein [Aigarchaeota archaeon]|nr:iron-containing redox enzyme family protein [Aigarchaeota archaeon]MDW8092800.1 iron-containing redox enzyme family protein [Nitrososphaerota archaeon]